MRARQGIVGFAIVALLAAAGTRADDIAWANSEGDTDWNSGASGSGDLMIGAVTKTPYCEIVY
jgi:hypothetical protein